VVVLAYHSISDLSGDRILAEYGVPPERFAAQLDALGRRWRFVGLGDVLGALDGAVVLPPRAILVTFDDAYADLLGTACPMLSQRGIPAVAFVVSDRVGATNTWRRSAARELPLLDADQLRELEGHGVVVGSHGATHRPLAGLEAAELEDELSGSAERLAAIGLPRPSVFSYPHGEWSSEVAEAVREAGYAAAFTVTPGAVRRQDNRYALPRVEVLASDSPRRLRVKAASAGWPAWLRGRLLRLVR
jgi:peptidoglycan/xylan/chitin deacetylase (PgdA/CDA1 family)